MNAEAPHIIVVGAGIAGTCIATVAREAGLSALIIDSPPPPGFVSGSRAAIGIMRVAWMKSVPQKNRCRRSIEWYKAHNLLLNSTARVSLYSKPEPREVADYWQVDVSNALSTPDRVDTVVKASQEGVITAAGVIYPARLGVVIAAGPQSPLLGGPQFDHVTIGATFIGPPEAGSGLRVHRYSPYHCLAISREAHCTRLGSSTVHVPYSPNPHIKVHNPVDTLQGLMKRCGGEFADPTRRATPLIGMRAHDAALTEGYEPLWLEERLVRFAGLGKLGYSLAPAVAEEIVAQLMRSRMV